MTEKPDQKPVSGGYHPHFKPLGDSVPESGPEMSQPFYPMGKNGWDSEGKRGETLGIETEKH